MSGKERDRQARLEQAGRRLILNQTSGFIRKGYKISMGTNPNEEISSN